MEGKRPSESAVESRYLLMLQQANPCWTAFGAAMLLPRKSFAEQNSKSSGVCATALQLLEKADKI
jgi:hypothetical protein